MRKGSEIAFDIKNVDCDFRLKKILIELQENNYRNHKDLLQLSLLMSQLVDRYNEIVSFSSDLKTKIDKFDKNVKQGDELDNDSI